MIAEPQDQVVQKRQGEKLPGSHKPLGAYEIMDRVALKGPRPPPRQPCRRVYPKGPA